MEDKDLKSPSENISPKEENPAPVNDGLIAIEPFDSDKDLETTVETQRAALMASYKKSRLISRIFTGGALALIIGAIIFITFNGMVFKIVGYAMAGLALVAMLVFYFKTRNIFPTVSKQYIREFTKVNNGFIFQDPRFKEMKVDAERKIDKAEVSIDRAYKEGAEVGSRNYTVGIFDGKPFTVAELAVYYQGDSKKNPRKIGFIGKYVTLGNSLKFRGRYIFNIKAKEADKIVDQPNDTEDLQLVLQDDNFEVYGPNKEYKEIFGTEFVKKLKEIKIEDPLLNFCAVVWEGHSAIYLSYDDSVTTIPFEHPFKKEPSEKYRSDLIKVLELFGKL